MNHDPLGFRSKTISRQICDDAPSPKKKTGVWQGPSPSSWVGRVQVHGLVGSQVHGLVGSRFMVVPDWLTTINLLIFVLYDCMNRARCMFTPKHTQALSDQLKPPVQRFPHHQVKQPLIGLQGCGSCASMFLVFFRSLFQVNQSLFLYVLLFFSVIQPSNFDTLEKTPKTYRPHPPQKQNNI